MIFNQGHLEKWWWHFYHHNDWGALIWQGAQNAIHCPAQWKPAPPKMPAVTPFGTVEVSQIPLETSYCYSWSAIQPIFSHLQPLSLGWLQVVILSVQSRQLPVIFLYLHIVSLLALKSSMNSPHLPDKGKHHPVLSPASWLTTHSQIPQLQCCPQCLCCSLCLKIVSLSL